MLIIYAVIHFIALLSYNCFAGSPCNTFDFIIKPLFQSLDYSIPQVTLDMLWSAPHMSAGTGGKVAEPASARSPRWPRQGRSILSHRRFGLVRKESTDY